MSKRTGWRSKFREDRYWKSKNGYTRRIECCACTGLFYDKSIQFYNAFEQDPVLSLGNPPDQTEGEDGEDTREFVTEEENEEEAVVSRTQPGVIFCIFISVLYNNCFFRVNCPWHPKTI